MLGKVYDMSVVETMRVMHRSMQHVRESIGTEIVDLGPLRDCDLSVEV